MALPDALTRVSTDNDEQLHNVIETQEKRKYMLLYATGDLLKAGQQARENARTGIVSTNTSGVAEGLVQANMICVPREWAYDVLLYAQRNPKPVPLLDVIEDGGYESILAKGSDVRTDIPKYRVWKNGELVDEPTDVLDAWRDDMVTFLIGCSFTFEAGLTAAQIEIRHQTAGRNVPMYRTNIQCAPAGRLKGEMVVSMRPIPAARVADAVEISGRYPAVHGAPVHIGDPAALGIKDIYAPDYGDAPVQIRDGEIPVFWACGVTPQAAVVASQLPYAITHAPGCMFVSDVLNESYAV
ncbi:putative hydro-lyase [Actinotignum urinale]|uniref:Putative hydro-lyase R6G80_03645 n=1 Tax=Actinotignum urinale TaxID=190146 RepID=A0AAW9HXT9_9ACTO|nr:putative hydro-lyase [Actinotignum urinale]MDY5154819.1 putative hydro-lyase [Actinotignum urinale]